MDQDLPSEITDRISKIINSQKVSLSIVTTSDQADVRIVPGKIKTAALLGTWYYAVCAPFYTIEDNIQLPDLLMIWKQSNGFQSINKNKKILIDYETEKSIKTILGQGSPAVIEKDKLIDELFKNKSYYSIVPFQLLNPELKVLHFPHFSLFEKGVKLDDYPLSLSISAQGKKEQIEYIKKIFGGELDNRDESKLTTIIMTGTTALTRMTAKIMETNGVTYPGLKIKDWLTNADFTHISNEVSFFPDCKPDFSSTCMHFCSKENYIELFSFIGADIIELSGNHLTDFGTEPLDHTLDLFQQNGFQWYAGGRNILDAMKPIKIIQGPNRIAFIGGCEGPSYHYANAKSSGPLKIDWNILKKEIQDLKNDNWLPIVTIQYWETYEYFPTNSQIEAFRSLADAGAVIVQGSQAHQPQSFDFHNNTFIHYGLGNLFFDQMWSIGTRQEFIDRHIFYNGKHISTELLTALLENYAQPRPMTSGERQQLLTSTFLQSFWYDRKYYQ